MTNTAQIIPHPESVARKLQQQRLYWMVEAARFNRRKDETNAAYCRGKAGGLDYAIVALGGEGINLSVADYLPQASGAA